MVLKDSTKGKDQVGSLHAPPTWVPRYTPVQSGGSSQHAAAIGGGGPGGRPSACAVEVIMNVTAAAASARMCMSALQEGRKVLHVGRFGCAYSSYRASFHTCVAARPPPPDAIVPRGEASTRERNARARERSGRAPAASGGPRSCALPRAAASCYFRHRSLVPPIYVLLPMHQHDRSRCDRWLSANVALSARVTGARTRFCS